MHASKIFNRGGAGGVISSSDAPHEGIERPVRHGEQNNITLEDDDRRKVEVPSNFCDQEISLA